MKIHEALHEPFMKLLLAPIVVIAEESLTSSIVLLQQRVQSKVVLHASGMPDRVLKHLHYQPTSPPLSAWSCG